MTSLASTLATDLPLTLIRRAVLHHLYYRIISDLKTKVMNKKEYLNCKPTNPVHDSSPANSVEFSRESSRGRQIDIKRSPLGLSRDVACYVSTSSNLRSMLLVTFRWGYKRNQSMVNLFTPKSSG